MLREAAGAYEEVLRRDPSLVQAYLRLSTAYCQLQEPAKAVDTCRQGVDNEPENPQLHLLLGDTYLRLGRIQEATLAYREVLRIDPTDTRAQTMLRLLSHATREDIPHPLPRNLNLEVALLGFDVHQARVEPGETLDVTLWWQALTCMNRDYTVFIHLTGPQGRIWAQEDRLLLRDDLPTSAWQVGWVVQDQYHVPLPCDVKPGEYAVTIGVYYWETGQRLPMWDGQFRRDPGDAIVLRAISVTPPSAGPDELAEKSALLLRRQASDP
jgi:tetratricopeptide (TPR) repeat protein